VTYKVLITDYAWPNLDVERGILSKIGAELLIPNNKKEGATQDELAIEAPAADAILVNWGGCTGKVIAAASKCSIIVRYGVGVDNIDIAEANKRGIIVCNVPDYCMDEVSNEAMAFLLAGARRQVLYNDLIRKKTWGVKHGMPFPRVQGLTLGIIGFGRIGRSVAPKALPFGLRVLVYDPYIDQKEITSRGCVPASFETLLKESDFITLHVPLTPETNGLINEKALRMMKKDAWLINTSRGPVVDTKALYTVMKEGHLAGAGLDVLPQEPPDWNDPLFTIPNITFTPHSAFYSEGSLVELCTKASQRVVEALSGQTPLCIMNPDVMKQSNLRFKKK
jgi:D-3-phosphoglycerate dehydrogenase / 2-oxoglutarate reductase